VLRSLRTEHGVPLVAVRQALAYAQRELKIDQLLLREELCTAGGELFLDRYGELMNLSASGQLEICGSITMGLASALSETRNG
jgi:hypothetical protein